MKSIVVCEQLEAYLDGDLSADEIAIFQSHLLSCDDCRGAIGQQQWLEDLLRSPQLAELEPAPAHILTTLTTTVSRRWRRKALLASGMAAAVLAFVAYWGVVNRQATIEGPVLAEVAPPAATQVKVSPAVFVAADGSIAVPVASEYPDVTIVRVYAAYRTDAAPNAAPVMNPDSDNNISHEPFNGG